MQGVLFRNIHQSADFSGAKTAAETEFLNHSDRVVCSFYEQKIEGSVNVFPLVKCLADTCNFVQKGK